MKRKTYIAVLVLCLFAALTTGAGSAFAAVSDWYPENCTVTDAPDGGVLLSGNGADEMVAEYSYGVDFRHGREFEYLLEDESCFSVGSEYLEIDPENPRRLMDNARLYDHSYVKFTALNRSGEGFEVAFYHQWADYDSKPNRIEINLTYLSPAIEADPTEGNPRGRRYVETLYSYRKNFGELHTVSCYQSGDAFYISADGSVFAPVSEYGTFDLSETTVTVSAKAVDTDIPKLRLSRPAGSFEPATFGTWGTLGESKISQNFDGTYRVEVDEESDRHNSENLILRETVFSTAGYDVRKPIVIEAAYDNDSTVAMWWGAGLGTNPFSAVRSRLCAANGTGAVIREPFDGDCLLTSGGVYVYAWQNLIQNSATGGTNDFMTNREGAYRSHGNLDRITYEIGENSTSLYYNEVLMFDDIPLKVSDFADSGYRAYPYFMFVETPANPNKNNVINIKGVNAPRRETYGTEKYRDDAEGDFEVALESAGSSVELCYDAQGRRPVDDSVYKFDAEREILTVSKAFFDRKPFAVHELFVFGESGIEYLPIRYVDSSVKVGPPAVNVEEFVYVKGSRQNIIVAADMNNLEFSRVYGAGMYLSDSSYDARMNKLIIMSSFLETLDEGTYDIHVESVDADGEFFVTTLKLKVLPQDAFSEGGSIVQKAWFWVVIGGSVLIVGAGVAAGVILLRKKKLKSK